MGWFWWWPFGKVPEVSAAELNRMRLDDTVRPQIENQLRQAALEAKLAELRGAATIETPETGMPPAAIRESDLLN